MASTKGDGDQILYHPKTLQEQCIAYIPEDALIVVGYRSGEDDIGYFFPYEIQAPCRSELMHRGREYRRNQLDYHTHYRKRKKMHRDLLYAVRKWFIIKIKEPLKLEIQNLKYFCSKVDGATIAADDVVMLGVKIEILYWSIRNEYDRVRKNVENYNSYCHDMKRKAEGYSGKCQKYKQRQGHDKTCLCKYGMNMSESPRTMFRYLDTLHHKIDVNSRFLEALQRKDLDGPYTAADVKNPCRFLILQLMHDSPEIAITAIRKDWKTMESDSKIRSQAQTFMETADAFKRLCVRTFPDSAGFLNPVITPSSLGAGWSA